MMPYPRLKVRDYMKFAREQGLGDIASMRYIIFMKERFPEEAHSSYAKEWAERFSKSPFDYADKETTEVLNHVFNDIPVSELDFVVNWKKSEERKNRKSKLKKLV
jgi:hypothetical protein